MITLYNKTTMPREGFSYYYLPPGHPEAVFVIPNGTSYPNALAKLMSYRAANPWLNLPADAGSCEHELQVYTFARLRSNPELGLKYAEQFFSAGPEDDPEIAEREIELKKNSPQMQQTAQRALQGVVVAAGNYTVGIATLRDWLGDGGKPVHQLQANGRALICEKCPMNQDGNWLERLAANVAGMVKKHIEAKNDLKLKVPNEDKLHTCAACRCNLSTKVWVPLKYITDHMKDETRAKLDVGCWILKEA